MCLGLMPNNLISLQWMTQLLAGDARWAVHVRAKSDTDGLGSSCRYALDSGRQSRCRIRLWISQDR